MIKKILFLTFALVAFVFIACDKDDNGGTEPTVGHDHALVATWNLTTFKVNGNVVDPNTQEGMPATVIFNSDGTGTVNIENYGQAVGSASLTWSTSGNQLTVTQQGEDPQIMTYIISGDNVTLSFVDEGDNIEITFSKSTTPPPTHDPALVATWDISGVTQNGTPVSPSLADSLPVKVTFNSDGTGSADLESYGQPAGTYPFTWSTSGNQLTLNLQGDTQVGTYTVSSTTMTFSFQDGTDNIVLTYNKSGVTPIPGTGSMSFTSTQGNFSANGTYDPTYNNTQGVGWYDGQTIAAYNVASTTSMSIALILFTGSHAVGTYSIPQQAAFSWALNFNPQDSTNFNNSVCLLMSGNVNVTSSSGNDLGGTFSGNGVFAYNITQPANVSNGTFSVSSTSFNKSGLPENIRDIINRIIE